MPEPAAGPLARLAGMRGTVVLATLDHARSVPAVLGELAVAAHELASDGVHLDVLVVDSGSTDDTVGIAVRAAADLGLALRVITSDTSGAWATQRRAFADALEHGRPDVLVTLDPSGHHDARQLHEAKKEAADAKAAWHKEQVRKV